MPANISVTTTNPAGTTVSYTMPTASDAGDPNPSVGCDPAPGSFFAVGSTTVTCTATDDAGHRASATFVVTVTYVHRRHAAATTAATTASASASAPGRRQVVRALGHAG